MNPTTDSSAPLLSEFVDDAEMMELVEMYVSELSDRVASLQRMWEEDSFADLRGLAHQLKGASGGYGFPIITEAAATLEQQLKQGCEDKGTLQDSFDQLIVLCKRAKA